MKQPLDRARRRPRYPGLFTTGITVHPNLSPAAKYAAAYAAALPGADPGVRILSEGLPFAKRTVTRALRELEQQGLADIIKRPGRRSRLRLKGLAVPRDEGRHRWAWVPSSVLFAAIDACSGRQAAHAPLLIQRLAREQAKRGGAHVSPAVLAADLDLKETVVLKLLGEVEAAGVVERHRAHELDSEELHVYTVPGVADQYRIDTEAIDPKQTNRVERLELGGHALTVIGREIDFNQLALRVRETPDATLEARIGETISKNLTGARILASDLLDSLRYPLDGASAPTYPVAEHPPSADSDPTSIAKAKAKASIRADARSEEGEPYVEPSSPVAGAEGKAINEQRTVEADLPLTTAAIKDALGYSGLPDALEDDLRVMLWTRQMLNDDEPLSARQLAILDDFLLGRLRRLETMPDEKRQRFAIVCATIERATHDDELHAALKAAQPWRVSEPEREPHRELLADLLEGTARSAGDV